MTTPRDAEIWFPCGAPRPEAEIRLFCFPFAGSGVAVYSGWSSELSERIELRPVLLPGRELRLREEPFRHVRPLTVAIADHMTRYLDRPFAFFGHSMGTLLAFETARELRRRGAPLPELLAVSSRPAPQLPRPHPLLHHLPTPEFLSELRRLFDPPDAAWADPELMKIVLPILRADLTVCDSYSCAKEAPLDCPILAFAGSADRSTSAEGLRAWSQQTTSRFELQLLPGGHFFFGSAAPTICARIERALGMRQG